MPPDDREAVAYALHRSALPAATPLNPIWGLPRLRAPAAILRPRPPRLPVRPGRLLAPGQTRAHARQPVAAVFSAMRVVDERGQPGAGPIPGAPTDRVCPTPLRPAADEHRLRNGLAISPEVRAASLPFPAPGLRGWHDQWLAAVAARIGPPLPRRSARRLHQHASRSPAMGCGACPPPRRARQYVRRMRASARSGSLRSRSGWVRAAARRLIELPGRRTPNSQTLAEGRWGRLVPATCAPVTSPFPGPPAGRGSLRWNRRLASAAMATQTRAVTHRKEIGGFLVVGVAAVVSTSPSSTAAVGRLAGVGRQRRGPVRVHDFRLRRQLQVDVRAPGDQVPGTRVLGVRGDQPTGSRVHRGLGRRRGGRCGNRAPCGSTSSRP